jgi:CheY-like chemotaxis protein
MTDLDLLVTDVMMPGTQGTELAVMLRRERSNLPVLFVSGYATEALTQEPPMAGTALLHKPFCADTLTSALEGLLEPNREDELSSRAPRA